jgi:hypothetical protein
MMLLPFKLVIEVPLIGVDDRLDFTKSKILPTAKIGGGRELAAVVVEMGVNER